MRARTRRQQQEWWWEKELRRSLGQDWTEPGQRAEPAAVHSSTGPHHALKELLYADDLVLVANGKQELQETLEEWNGLFTRHGLKINVEKTEVLPEVIARHRAGGEETDSRGQFRVPRRGSVRRREDGERGTSKSTGWSERMGSS